VAFALGCAAPRRGRDLGLGRADGRRRLSRGRRHGTVSARIDGGFGRCSAGVDGDLGRGRRAAIEGVEDAIGAGAIERRELLEVPGAGEEIPRHRVAAALEVGAEALGHAVKRVLVADEEVDGRRHGSARGLRGRHTAAVDDDAGDVLRDLLGVPAEVRSASGPAGDVDLRAVDGEARANGGDLTHEPVDGPVPAPEATLVAPFGDRALDAEEGPPARADGGDPRSRRGVGVVDVAVERDEERRGPGVGRGGDDEAPFARSPWFFGVCLA
jgi:hypothetical protein